ncbi:MAG: DUF1326 domain-containing protein [Burkholderiales bacterium]
MDKQWKLTGAYFESCNCNNACPCVFLSAPTTGECMVFVGWHIDHGYFGDINLDGFNVVAAVHSPGHMLEVKWKLALYLDEKANPAQQESLTQIFSGQAGGHPAVVASFVGDVLGVRPAPIEFHAQGKQRSLRISGVLEMEVEALEGQGGAEVIIANQPLCIVPGVPSVVAKSKLLKYRDYFPIELSGKAGFYSPFSYEPA